MIKPWYSDVRAYSHNGEILAYISKEDANVGAEVCQPYAPMLGTSMYAG